MSTFKVEIEDLVGSVGDDTFLNDSVRAIAKEIINALPADKLWSVAEESEEINANGFDVEEARVLQVRRENGTDNIFANCMEVSSEYEDKVQDADSMFKPSANNPVYLLKSGKVYVYPTPGSSPNKFKVTTVGLPSSVDVGTLEVGSTASNATNFNFPKEHEDLVVIGAAAKGLQYLMARVKDNFSGLAPTFVSPTLETINAMSLPAAPASIESPAFTTPDIADSSVSFTETPPAYVTPSQTFDMVQFESFLETNEDPELAQVQLGRLNTELGEFQSDIQNSLNKFNEENVKYQAELQKAIQNAQLLAQDRTQTASLVLQEEQQEYANKLSKYQADVSKYQAEVATEVQRWSKEEYEKKFQKYISDYSRLVEKYNADVQKYNTDLAKYNAEYGWYQDQYTKLDAQYKQGLQIILAESMPNAQAGV